MARTLPPLNALRAFEAAARHLSFTEAAAELHVTQAAVSHQVKALEERLGIKLFRRVGRRLLLTDAAQRYLPEVAAAFDQLAAATQRLKAEEAHGALNATVMPSFAAKWLLPRLGRFRAAHPEIDLRISSSSNLVDLQRADFDIGIRIGRGKAWPGLRADLIATEFCVPVVSPALLAARPIREPADLARHVLLHDDQSEDWQIWLRLVGMADIDTTRGPGFSDASMVIQAAIDGQGVAIARGTLAAADIAAGRLVKLFERSFPADYSYFLVCREADAGRPKIAAFRGWLLAEAGKA
jgi:LysR family glycine cleavage system transcriptional activator